MKEEHMDICINLENKINKFKHTYDDLELEKNIYHKKRSDLE